MWNEQGAVITLDRDASREVDRRAVEDYAMSSLVLMENAGRALADRMGELGITGRVVVVSGAGNNAGDGFVLARHLELRGHDVRLLLVTAEEKLRGEAAANFEILRRAETPMVSFPAPFDPIVFARELEGAQWVVDALLGTGARGEPRFPVNQAIEEMNRSNAKRLAVDIPSGLDCNMGLASETTFLADHTCTFVANKIGFKAESAKEFLGRVSVLDIGVPRKLMQQVAKQSTD